MMVKCIVDTQHRMTVYSSEGRMFIEAPPRDSLVTCIEQDVIPFLNRHPEWHVRVSLPLASMGEA